MCWSTSIGLYRSTLQQFTIKPCRISHLLNLPVSTLLDTAYTLYSILSLHSFTPGGVAYVCALYEGLIHANCSPPGGHLETRIRNHLALQKWTRGFRMLWRQFCSTVIGLLVISKRLLTRSNRCFAYTFRLFPHVNTACIGLLYLS